jgi:hypothetical protein
MRQNTSSKSSPECGILAKRWLGRAKHLREQLSDLVLKNLFRGQAKSTPKHLFEDSICTASEQVLHIFGP